MLCVCLSHCSCFPLEYSLAYTTAFSRFSFIFCKYFFGCNPKRGGKLMSPVQLSFNTANFMFQSLMYSTGCPSSSGSYSVLVPWSGGVSWVLLRHTSEIFAIPPRAPEVAVHSDHRNRGYSLFLLL